MICVFPYPSACDREEFCRTMFGSEIPVVFLDLGFVRIRDATSALRYLCPIGTRIRAELTFIRKAACWGVHIRAPTNAEEVAAKSLAERTLRICQKNTKRKLKIRAEQRRG